MKKIIWLIVLLFMLYIVMIFMKPTITNEIAKKLWLENFNKNVVDIKNKLDYISTKVPTKQEIEKAYSWAKTKISDIKENIDNVRKTAKQIEEKYDEAKQFIDKTWEKIEKVKQTVNDIQKIWWELKELISTWSTKTNN